MEYEDEEHVIGAQIRLNPCYNGMTMEYTKYTFYHEGATSLNPCYNGMTME